MGINPIFNMKVLFIQEKPVLSVALKLALQKEGFELIICQKKWVYPTLSQHTPGVVITELIDEQELILLSYLKEQHIPVIVLTNNGQGVELQQAFDLGADDYIPLPYSFTDVVLRVNKLKCKLQAVA